MNVQQRVSSWLSARQLPPSAMSPQLAKDAAQDLGVSLASVQQARAALVDAASANTAQLAGAAQQIARGSTSAGFGGAAVAQTAVGARFSTVDPRRTAFDDSNYTLLDAKAAQKTFGAKDLEGGKRAIGERVLAGRTGELDAAGIRPGDWDSHELKDAFSRSSYSTDDAKAALKAFNFLSNIDDAREYIGLKIKNGAAGEQILSDVGITPNNFDRHDCLGAFSRSAYSEADVAAAQKAFSFLQGSSAEDVREYIGLKIVNNYEVMLADVGIVPGSDKPVHVDLSPAGQYAAFRRSGYSDADADAARAAWGFLKGSSDREVKEYIGLKVLNGPEMEQQFLGSVGITRQNWDDHDLMAAFNRSGYGSEAVSAARIEFDFLRNDSDVEIQKYIGLKVVNNNTQMLTDVGILPVRD